MSRLQNIFMIVIWLALIHFTCVSKNSCPENPAQLITEYQGYVEKIKNTDRFYSTKQWTEKEKEHIRLIDECYPTLEPMMSTSQEEAFWSSVIEYYLFRHKGNIEIIFDTSVPKYALLQSKIKTIWPDPYEAFEQVFKHATDMDFREVLESMKTQTEN